MRDIHAHLRIGDPSKPIPEFIKGTIDLIVVDGDGSLHLYDFKTSKHKYRDWPKTKRDGVIVQLETYAAILRQMTKCVILTFTHMTFFNYIIITVIIL